MAENRDPDPGIHEYALPPCYAHELSSEYILVPSRGPTVLPDIVIAPVVGFDGANYRLGYGGGFFDRTLAAMHRRPLAIGVGYAGSRLETIRP